MPMVTAPKSPADARTTRGAVALWRWDLMALAVILAATLPWWRAVGLPFILIDDPAYVVNNPDVQGGLTLQGLAHAFASHTGGLWSPLTFASLMLDVSLWGKGPAGIHATNVVLHIANACLLYQLLRRLTGRPVRSLMVALLFAMHPLRVESVAWVTERKDVLAAFFGLLALLAYGWYARSGGLRRAMAYGLVCLLLACSLLGKPMLLTFPFLLLLLDYWPLARWGVAGERRRVWRGLLLEKVPLLCMVGAMGIITVQVQVQERALTQNARYSFAERFGNALMSYLLYLRDHVYFNDLAVFYPEEHFTAGQVVSAGVLLGAISAAVVIAWRRFPAVGKPLLAGWCIFLGVLVPNIGLLQSGGQQRADRYTYFPSIGLFIALAWLWPDEWFRGRGRLIGGISAAAAIGLLTFNTNLRLALWSEPLNLYLDGLRHTGPNPVLAFVTGQALGEAGDDAGAIQYYALSLRWSPTHAVAHNNLAIVLMKVGDRERAVQEFKRACDLEPGNAMYHANYQRALAMLAPAGPPPPAAPAQPSTAGVPGGPADRNRP